MAENGKKHPLAEVDAGDIAPTREEFLALEQEFLDIQGDDSDAALSRRHQIRMRLRTFGPHGKCGPEPMVEIMVPQPVGSSEGTVNGDFFRISNKVYVGKCLVPACVARELGRMIAMNRQIDQERFRGQQKLLTGFEITAKNLG